MAHRWYVIHVYSGFERKVAQSIQEQTVQKGLQDEIVEVFVEDVVDDVGDVGCQPDAWTGQVHTLTDTGQARRVRLMSRRPQLPPHEVKPVGATPGAMHQHEHRHPGDTTPLPDPVPSCPGLTVSTSPQAAHQ